MQSGQKGFTLLELLISMTLMALLMGGLLVGLRVGARAWQQGEARLREVHKEEERAAFMAQQVSSLVPYEVGSTDPDLPGRVTIFQAHASRLRFVSTYGSRFRNRSGLVLVDYAIVGNSPGKLAIALRETPVGDDGTLFQRLVERVARDPETGKSIIIYRPFSLQGNDLRLITGLRMARFEYFDPHPEDSGPRWLWQWEGKPKAPYPTAIRLRWQREGQTGQEQETFPIPAHLLPQ